MSVFSRGSQCKTQSSRFEGHSESQNIREWKTGLATAATASTKKNVRVMVDAGGAGSTINSCTYYWGVMRDQQSRRAHPTHCDRGMIWEDCKCLEGSQSGVALC